MRALAARLRADAATTRIGLFRRKLEGLASELEEAAAHAEAMDISDLKRRTQ